MQGLAYRTIRHLLASVAHGDDPERREKARVPDSIDLGKLVESLATFEGVKEVQVRLP